MILERIDESGTPLGDLSSVKEALAAGEALHRAFRPAIGDDYLGEITRILNEGAGLTQLVVDGEVKAIALWRLCHTTYCGRRFEIDDFVTDPQVRSKGYGATLLSFLEDKARKLGCPTLTLNSGTHRTDAHRFYHRQRYAVIAFHFSKALKMLE